LLLVACCLLLLAWFQNQTSNNKQQAASNLASNTKQQATSNKQGKGWGNPQSPNPSDSACARVGGTMASARLDLYSFTTVL